MSVLALQAVGCAQFRDDGAAADAGVTADGPAEASPGKPDADAAVSGDAGADVSSMDATSTDGDGASPEASPEAAPPDAGPEAGLDPLLSVPPSGPTCDVAQGDSVCASSNETCRIASPTSGTCDTFTTGHEGGFPCTTSEDCDDTLQCYKGTCHVLCPLGMTCAGGCACFDVGNDAVGLCCPGQ